MDAFEILFYIPGDEEPHTFVVSAETTFCAEEKLYEKHPQADVREITTLH